MTLTQTLLNHFPIGLYPASLVEASGAAYGLRRRDDGARVLVIAAPAGHPALAAFHGERHAVGDATVIEGAVDTANARALREALPWLRPVPLGLATSAGCGDRLGLATPGHARAFRTVGGRLAAIFAQQSIREMSRTNRSPDDVLTDATFGALQAGWREPVGADADHLKTPADIDACAAAGFSFFTIDPGAHVNDAAEQMQAGALEAASAELPWTGLETSHSDFMTRYAGRKVDLDDRRVVITPSDAARAAVKYSQAVAHVVVMQRHLASRLKAYDLEVSVDETESPTRLGEHIIIASELKRLGAPVVSLAPRFVGRFEKGVDYIGDLEALRENLNAHAAVARAFGPYKLSLHSGSDKFSVYPLIVAATHGVAHLKTAGTSYLEGLRVIAAGEPGLFREIVALARERYDTDKLTYHISARLERVPAPDAVSDADLAGLLNAFDARQALHVTFGSALARFGARIMSALSAREEAFAAGLERHFVRHLAPFAQASA
ncbi:MAG: tagaturonate epimerase family protein [Thermoflexales bacterium]